MRALLAKPLRLGAILLLLAAVAEFSSLRALSGPENRLMDALVRMQARMNLLGDFVAQGSRNAFEVREQHLNFLLEKSINAAQQVILRNVIVEIEGVEQSVLAATL